MSIEKQIKPEVVTAIELELQHQCSKWGADKQQSLPGYLLIMKYELDEAIDGWMKDKVGRNSPLNEIVQVVTTGICALNYYGINGTARSTSDVTENEMKEEKLHRSLEKWGLK